jgi:hypothetical protein
MINTQRTKGVVVMIVTTFQRYENKFILNEEQYRSIVPELRDHMILDSFCRESGRYPVNTIYFDTPEYTSIRRCRTFPAYKEKLRLRSYGTPKSDDDRVFLCIKKKLFEVGNKRRAVLTLAEANEFLETRRRPANMNYSNTQVLSEIDYFMSGRQYSPAACICYMRQAYTGRDDPELRITFDTDISYRSSDVDLKKGSYGSLILPKNDYLMEIKIPEAIPLWLADALSRVQAYPQSFSKYGKAFDMEIQKPEKRIAV